MLTFMMLIIFGMVLGRTTLKRTLSLCSVQGINQFYLIRADLLKASVQIEYSAKNGYGDSCNDDRIHIRTQPHNQQWSQSGFWQTVQHHQIRFQNLGELRESQSKTAITSPRITTRAKLSNVSARVMPMCMKILLSAAMVKNVDTTRDGLLKTKLSIQPSLAATSHRTKKDHKQENARRSHNLFMVPDIF